MYTSARMAWSGRCGYCSYAALTNEAPMSGTARPGEPRRLRFGKPPAGCSDRLPAPGHHPAAVHTGLCDPRPAHGLVVPPRPHPDGSLRYEVVPAVLARAHKLVALAGAHPFAFAYVVGVVIHKPFPQPVDSRIERRLYRQDFLIGHGCVSFHCTGYGLRRRAPPYPAPTAAVARVVPPVTAD